MNIAFYCSSNSWGGLEMNLIERANWFASSDYGVELFGLKGSPFAQNSGNHSLHEINRQAKSFPVRAAFSLLKKLRSLNTDILILSDNRDLALGAWVSFFSFRKIKIVYMQAMKLSIPKRDLIHTIRYSRIDAWITSLPYLKKQTEAYIRINKDKVHVARLGVDAKRYAARYDKLELRRLLNLPTDKHIIGLVGRVDEQKGQLVLIKAFAELRDRDEWHLAFLGDFTANEESALNYFNEIQAYIKEKGLEDSVQFIPFRKDVEKFYAAIDIFVMASRSETYGMVTVEAMMAGNTILGTNAGGTPELLNHGEFGVLFEPDNHQDLSEKLNAISEQSPDNNFKREDVREHAIETYSHSTEFQKLEDIFKSITKSHK